MKKLNLLGKRIGRLVVLAPAKQRGARTFWLCRCDCGTVKEVGTDSLRATTRSCGCLQREGTERVVTKHGHNRGNKRSPEYRSWVAAKGRCEDPNNIGYKNYGAKGVAFKWSTFEEFLFDMGLKPTPKHTLERLNRSGNYEAGNCVWATRAEQSRNTCRTIIVTWQGKNYALKDLAAHVRVRYSSLLYYFRKKQFPLEQAVERSSKL